MFFIIFHSSNITAFMIVHDATDELHFPIFIIIIVHVSLQVRWYVYIFQGNLYSSNYVEFLLGPKLDNL